MNQFEIENIKKLWNYLDISMQKELVQKYIEDEGTRDQKNWMEFLADNIAFDEHTIK